MPTIVETAMFPATVEGAKELSDTANEIRRMITSQRISRWESKFQILIMNTLNIFTSFYFLSLGK